MLDRLRLDPARIENICSQLRALAALPRVDPLISRNRTAGVVVEVRRIPVGTIGANFEARANVPVDIASQLIKSRNGGVLRTAKATERMKALGIESSLPPHDHAIGHEWATDPERAATVTLARVEGVRAAAELANRETSGLAASIVVSDPQAAESFIEAYEGTGVFWNETTRLLDGYRLFGAPETGINVDRVPGPRGPVTYRDLYLRQVVVQPAGATRSSA